MAKKKKDQYYNMRLDGSTYEPKKAADCEILKIQKRSIEQDEDGSVWIDGIYSHNINQKSEMIDLPKEKERQIVLWNIEIMRNRFGEKRWMYLAEKEMSSETVTIKYKRRERI